MYVPEHITATGDELQYGDNSTKRQSARLSIIEQMEVPDRITVNGGDSYGRITDDYQRGVQIPVEYNPRLKDIPDVLTAADTCYDDSRRQIETARTDNSMVVDEDPLRELKMLRRQMGKIQSRILYLEEQNEKRGARENLLAIAFIGLAITAIWNIIKH